MTLGTKSLLFGVHQFILHPLLVLIAWVKLYGSFPNWKELVCIIIHDWGYWGVADVKGERGDRHPEYGAKLAFKWFGFKYHRFILGHSSFYIARHGVKRSKLLAPDKYWHCMVPLWFYKIMSVPTGEFKYYRGMQHARQVTALEDSDKEWWSKLQKVCMDKVNDNYVIDKERLS